MAYDSRLNRTIDDLKTAGRHFAAGALAHSLGLPRASYGCHFGMRSELAEAKRLYAGGWDAADQFAKHA